MRDVYDHDENYRILYDGADMGNKWKLQRKEYGHWMTVNSFATYGEAKHYWVQGRRDHDS